MTALEVREVMPTMSLKAAAAFLSVSHQYVYRLTYRREIPFIRLGRKIVFRRIDLDAYLAAHTIPAKSA